MAQGVGGIAQLGQLTHDIVVLTGAGLLVVERHLSTRLLRLQDKTRGRQREGHVDRHLALGYPAGQHLTKGHITVTVQGHARTEHRRHLLRIKAVALGTVHPKALQFMVGIDEAEAIAIGEVCYTGHAE